MDRPAVFKAYDKTTQYMTFELIERKERTGVWMVVNNKSNAQLGIIYWYNPWRQYVLAEIDSDVVFNWSCLDDIKHFLTSLNKGLVALPQLSDVSEVLPKGRT